MLIERARPAAALFAVLLFAAPMGAETIPVRNVEGLVRGFLVLRTLEGRAIARGDLIQTSRGGSRVTSRLVFYFRDGSVQDETAVFTQRGRFRLVSDRLVQKGPSFPHPIDLSIDAAGGRVTIRHRDDEGKEQVIEESMALPDDLANGILLTLLKNIPPGATETTASMIVASPKPRLVKLVIARAGKDPFSVAGATHGATRFQVKIDLGGLAGVVAPLIGKQPPDSSVWILEGAAPGFVRSESAMYAEGPIWRIDLASPSWPPGRAKP